MYSQKVNRYSKKLHKKRLGILRPGTGLKPVRDGQTGFIHHPRGFPIEYKRVWFNNKQSNAEPGKIGIIFETQNYIKPGTRIEITIPLRHEMEKFRGKVVLVRNHPDFYEIGLWLSDQADVSRMRMVEQVCHIETYLQEKKYRDGPFILNRERIAAEWITKYASNVPTP